MKPYGIPRIHELEGMDCADIKKLGAKSSSGRNPSHGKEKGRKNSLRSTIRKAQIRRYWNRLERTNGKNLTKATDNV